MLILFTVLQTITMKSHTINTKIKISDKPHMKHITSPTLKNTLQNKTGSKVTFDFGIPYRYMKV